MGGQLVFDALTAFAGDVPGGMPRVDFWCASGGQIGLFAELGMFAGGPPEAVSYTHLDVYKRQSGRHTVGSEPSTRKGEACQSFSSTESRCATPTTRSMPQRSG